MLTQQQIRMARAALGMTVREVAALADLHHNTVSRAENGEMSKGTLAVLKLAFETKGVTFLDDDGNGPGVRLKSS